MAAPSTEMDGNGNGNGNGGNVWKWKWNGKRVRFLARTVGCADCSTCLHSEQRN